MILETYENNNLAGKEVTVVPPRVKWIEATAELDSDVCEPSGSILVKGKANYNSEFNFVPVKNAEVTIIIMDTNISDQTLTDKDGHYEKTLSAPSICKKYKIVVDIKDDENIGLKNDEKIEIIFEVVALVVSVNINPTYCLGYDDVQVYGKVTDPVYEVSQATVNIRINGLEDNWFELTDNDGIYSKSITAPTPNSPTIYIINVTAEKDDIICCNFALHIWVSIP